MDIMIVLCDLINFIFIVQVYILHILSNRALLIFGQTHYLGLNKITRFSSSQGVVYDIKQHNYFSQPPEGELEPNS